MLRRIRAKLHPTSVRLQPVPVRLSSSAALARSKEDVEEQHQQQQHHDSYGTEYGAGPSRLPYQSHTFRSELSFPTPSQRPQAYGDQDLACTHRTARQSAPALRSHLQQLNHGHYSQLEEFLLGLFRQPHIWTTSKQPSTFATLRANLATVSRLEFHTIIHHLIRQKRGNLAASLYWEVLFISPREERRRILSPKSVTALFRDRSSFNFLNAKSAYAFNRSPPNLKPTIKDQKSPTPGRDLQVLLNVLDAMQDVRARRPPEFYETIIRGAVFEHQFDLAAKIYVGLVEEWVTEGRVAHGANPNVFHPGGGPPREENPIKMSDLLAHWWTGVRTWRFPGEALSPHDRLDLWHPKHLSLGEKMRNFPLPLATSPPTMVPQPKAVLLRLIVNSLRLDPETVSPVEFASSMRALAILANTVLSRTLPIVALGRLLQAFKSAPFKPEVYPDHITAVPEDEAWAYTSYAQIHITLMSLLFAPPISSHSMEMIAANQEPESEADLAETKIEEEAGLNSPKVGRYMLPPLSWSSCKILLQYALDSLKQPKLLVNLITYMKDVFAFGGKDPQAYNIIMKGASKLMDNQLAKQADSVLFGESGHGRAQERPSHAPAPRDNPRGAASALRVVGMSPSTASEILIPMVDEGNEPVPDEEALILLVYHLTASSQFKRLEELIYKLEPYLNFSKSMGEDEVARRMEQKGVSPGISGRPRSEPMTPRVYLALLRGFEKAGSTGLAQRIFDLALVSERRMAENLARKAALANPNPESAPLRGSSVDDLPQSLRLPIDVFTTMMNVWANEARFAQRALAREKAEADRNWGHFDFRRREMPIGWRVPEEFARMPRGPAAGWMAVRLHHQVRERFDPAQMTEGYYQSLLRACRWRWKLKETKSLFTGFRPEVFGLIRDMEDSGVDIPDVLIAKLRDQHKPVERSGVKWNPKTRRDPQAKTTEDKLLSRIMGNAGPGTGTNDESVSGGSREDGGRGGSEHL